MHSDPQVSYIDRDPTPTDRIRIVEERPNTYSRLTHDETTTDRQVNCSHNIFNDHDMISATPMTYIETDRLEFNS